MTRWSASLLYLGLLSGLLAQTPIGFIEEFSLAPDREPVLAKLVPGSPEHYYYSCLHYLHRGELEKVDALLKPWTERFGLTNEVNEIRSRRMLVLYDRNPRAALEEIRRELNLQFNHQPVRGRPVTTFPTRLDPKLISLEVWQALALRHEGVNGFTPAGMDFAGDLDLPVTKRRDWLRRLALPDHPSLARMVVTDLRAKDAGGFGYLPIHRLLTQAQLAACLEDMPELRQNDVFVTSYLQRLAPAEGVDWENDPVAKEAYLDRLWAFAGPLSPAFNSLKASLLHQRLAHDLTRGVYDRARLMEYLKLPRDVAYINRDYRQKVEHRNYPANLQQDFRPHLPIPPIRNDEPLVRTLLLHFLATEESYQAWSEVLAESYLKELFAEAKLTGGVGEAARYYELLSAARHKEIKDRVDLDFAADNPRRYRANDPVALKVWVKNVEKLIINIYHLNSLNYYREMGHEVDLDVNLEGLVPNEQQTHTFTEAPIRRVARTFEFPGLRGPGVYIIECIGGGKSSRAVIRKGQLRALFETTAAGQRATIIGEDGKALPKAAVWLAGHRLEADAEGQVIIPFSSQPGEQPIILEGAGTFTLTRFQHLPEAYDLQVAMQVDRESLMRGAQARLLLRPDLRVHGIQAPLALLEQPVLSLTATDSEGVPTSREYRDLKLTETGEVVLDFQVPERLRRLDLSFSASIKSLLKGQPIAVSATRSFELNTMDDSDQIDDLHLARYGADYTLEWLGKNGEPRAGRPVSLQLQHRLVQDMVHVQLQTDAAGRIVLGPLPEVTKVWANFGRNRIFYLTPETANGQAALPPRLVLQPGETLSLPWFGETLTRGDLAMLELRGGQFVADHLAKAKLAAGQLTVAGLAQGQYLLLVKATGQRLTLDVVPGKPVADFLVNDGAAYFQPPTQWLQISEMSIQGDQLQLRLANADAGTRVQLFGDRYLPAFEAFGNLAVVLPPAPAQAFAPFNSRFESGRRVGDEYAYIINRRYAPKLVGNLLRRPGLLLNPFSLRKTETGRQVAQEGEAFYAAGEEKARQLAGGGPAMQRGRAQGYGLDKDRSGVEPSACLDFLAQPGVLLANLRPDAQGLISIPLAQLGGKQDFYAVAIKGEQTVLRRLTRAEDAKAPRDLRFARGLDPAKPALESRTAAMLRAGTEFTLADVGGGRFEVYDTLARAWNLLRTLNPDATFQEFSFLLQWPTLTPAEQEEKYGKYASHELHFFLYRKDPAFFNRVIKPYLANKKDQTFLDHWLLEHDLTPYLDPWQYSRLNAFERILLARRLPGEAAAAARELRELVELLPPDPERDSRLFDAALGGSALDTSDDFGVRNELQEQRSKELDNLGKLEQAAARRVAPSEMPAAPPPAVAPGAAAGKAASREMALADDAAPLEMAEKADGSEFAKKAMDNRKVLEARRDKRSFYQRLDKTEEWAENNYYKLPIEQQHAELIVANAFWRDWAAHDPAQPFVSGHLVLATRNFSEMLLAMAVLDLPFTAERPASVLKEGALTLSAKTHALLFYKELRAGERAADQPPLLLSQNYYRPDDRYRHEAGERIEKFITGELSVNTVYGTLVTVTNPTGSRQKLDLLLQLPVGSLPVIEGWVTKGQPVVLEPYTTRTFEYHFYFPKAGEFSHFPAHTARNGLVLAAAPGGVLSVVDRPLPPDTSSWEYISQQGSGDEVMTYLEKQNLRRLNLAMLAWRVKDKAFFSRLLTLLRQQHAFEPTLWSYGILHQDLATAREYLRFSPLAERCGLALDCQLMTLDPVERRQYQHLEYFPLVNARAHQLGTQKVILNQQLAAQYQRLLKVLSYRPVLDDSDRLAVAYYHLLQDRVTEAATLLAQVQPQTVHTRLQLDYLQLYLAVYRGDAAAARALATTHRDHPVPRWRTIFREALAQFDEIAGQGPVVTDPEDRDQRQGALAATEPALQLQIAGRDLQLRYQNLTSVTINYYLMDLEMLFSRNPFMQQDGSQLVFIKPNQSQVLTLPAAAAAQGLHTLPLPAELATRNVLVEVLGAGQRRTAPYFSTALQVQMIENYGQLKVTLANGQPQPGVYVKVYARNQDGSLAFYKDGYSDLRGRFDYSSLSTDDLDRVQRFAVLVLSDEHGGVIREAPAPKL